jgi:hypothetical protein
MSGEPEHPRYRDRWLRSEIAHLGIEAYRSEEISHGRALELSKTLSTDGDTLLHVPKWRVGRNPSLWEKVNRRSV